MSDIIGAETIGHGCSSIAAGRSSMITQDDFDRIEQELKMFRVQPIPAAQMIPVAWVFLAELALIALGALLHWLLS